MRLDDVLLSLGSHFVYTYDMGDSWEHTIVLEKRLPVDPNLTYPVCFGGERACPPEDIGGIYMFQELLEAFRDPEHERHQEMLEWVGEEWDRMPSRPMATFRRTPKVSWPEPVPSRIR